MSEYFPELKVLGKVKVESDLSNYTTKTDLKNETGIDALSFAKRVDLTNIKSNVDKLDIDKLKNVPTNLSNSRSKVDKLDFDKIVPGLSKLSDTVKNDVVKKDLYSAYTKDIEDKIPDITNLATKTTLNSEINEVNGEITNITNLDTTSSLTAVENIIPSVSNLVKKIDFNTKNNDTNKKLTDHNHDKYITTPDFITFTAEVFD